MRTTITLHHGIPELRDGSRTTYTTNDRHTVLWLYRHLRDLGLRPSSARMALMVTGNILTWHSNSGGES